MTLMYELNNRILRKVRRMAFLSIVHSQGLSGQQHSCIQSIKKDRLYSLEHLAAEKVLGIIATGQVNASSLASIPYILYSMITGKITSTGLALPAISLMLVNNNCVTSLDLTCYKQNGVTAPVLKKIRHLKLFKLVIDNNEFITDDYLADIACITSLTYLSLCGCHQLSNRLFDHIKDLGNLRFLLLSNLSKVTSAGVAQLVTSSHSFLEYIDLSKTSVEESDDINIFETLKHHKNLTGLNLSSVKKLNTLHGIELLQALRHLVISNNTLSRLAIKRYLCQLQQLEHLDMDGCKMLDFDYACLENIFALPRLRYLNMNVKMATTTKIYRSTPYLPLVESSNLSTLCIANSFWLTDRIFSMLLQSLPRLLELDISLTKVSSECIGRELPQLSRLHTLGLQGVRLHDEDMLFLSYLLRLKKLNINDTQYNMLMSRCVIIASISFLFPVRVPSFKFAISSIIRLGDAFVTDVFLNKCQHLELLSLCRSQITDKGLSSLRLQRLQTVWLDECNITAGAALALSSNNCPALSYISMRNLLPRLDHDEDENLAADILGLLD